MVAAPDSEEAEADGDKVDKLDKQDLDKLKEDVIAENDKLAQRLANLENQLDTQQNADDIIKMLKGANQERFKSNINNLANRYEAGERVIHHIIKEINQFNLSFSQLLLQHEFASLSDPTTYTEFNNAMNNSLSILEDRNMLKDIGNVDDLKEKIPMVANPLVSTGISVAFYALAKYHKKSKEKMAAFDELTCVLDYTNQEKTNYQLMASNLIQLNNRLDAFRDASKDFFSEYLQVIDYEGGYEKYVYDKKNSSDNFMHSQCDIFFGDMLADVSNVGITGYDTRKDDNVLFYLEQVKFYLNEYELILLEINDFIKNYEKFVSSHQDMQTDICGSFQTETKEIFARIEENLEKVQHNFQIVYEENRIDKNTKRILFGF